MTPKKLLLLFVLSLSIGTSCAGTPKDVPAAPIQQEQTEATEPVLKTIPKTVAPKDVFATIVAQYKGSVVFFDFWATWCPPCRQAMKMVDDIKPSLAAKGCKFVYLTGETSPQADFDTMYKTIEGDHFYLTNEQFKGLCDQFGVQGIPFYILVDKQGNILYQHTGYPGNDEVQSQIEAAL